MDLIKPAMKTRPLMCSCWFGQSNSGFKGNKQNNFFFFFFNKIYTFSIDKSSTFNKAGLKSFLLKMCFILTLISLWTFVLFYFSCPDFM